MEDNNTVILSDKEEYIYVLYKSSEEEVKEFEDLLIQRMNDRESIKDLTLNTFLDKIYLCGNINETTEGHVKEIIPIYKEHKQRNKIVNHEGFKIDTVIEYKCFSRPSKTISTAFNSLILHEEPLSSFKCACATKNIKYYYILKTKKEYPYLTLDKVKETLNEILSNNSNNE